MQTTSSKIWTQVTDFISSDKNRYTTGAYFLPVQSSSPNMGMIPFPIGWSFRWSDISSDETTDSLSAHVVFLRSRQQINHLSESLVGE